MPLSITPQYVLDKHIHDMDAWLLQRPLDESISPIREVNQIVTFNLTATTADRHNTFLRVRTYWTDRQSGRQAGIQAGRQTCRHTGIHASTQATIM